MHRFASLAVLVALLAAGCGGDDGSPTGADPVADAGAATDGGGTISATDGGDPALAAGDYAELMGLSADASFDVTYDVTAAGSATTIRFAQLPPHSSYFESDDQSIVTNADGSVACDPTNSRCVAAPVQASMMIASATGPAAALLNNPSGLGLGANLDTSTDTVAGREVRCAEISTSFLGAAAAGGEGTFTSCIDAETGVLMRTAYDVQGQSFRIEATSFSASPDPSLFEPPFPVEGA